MIILIIRVIIIIIVLLGVIISSIWLVPNNVSTCLQAMWISRYVKSIVSFIFRGKVIIRIMIFTTISGVIFPDLPSLNEVW